MKSQFHGVSVRTNARAGAAYDMAKLLGGKVPASFLDADSKFNADGSYSMAEKK